MASRAARLILDDGTIFRNIAGYTVSEDATPISLADQSGGSSQSSITLSDQAVDGKMLHRRTATMTDGANGETAGRIASPSGDGTSLTLPLDSALSNLTATRTALPFSGTVAAYFGYLLGLIGVTSPIIDSSFAAVSGNFAGWNGDVRTNLWALCSVYNAEVTAIGTQVHVRPVRERIITNRRDSSLTWALTDDQLAQSIQGYWYDTQPLATDVLAYPPGGWNSSVQVLTVPAGGEQEYDLNLTNFDSTTGEGPGFSVSSIVQPVCVSSVGPTDSGASAYTVCGDDGLPVTPAEWAALGGSLTVTINPDGQSLHVKITGMASIGDAAGNMIQTYSIAMSSGSSTNYSSLRILGTGVSFTKHLVTAYTGLTADAAPTAVGVTVDTPYITDPGTLWSRLTWPLASAMGPSQSIQVTSREVNRAGDSGTYAVLTINDFDAHYAGDTINQIDADNSGLTLDQAEAKEQAWVTSSFQNQAFGNVAGARILYDGAWYRVSTATITNSQTSYTAVADTTIDDFDTFYAGLTIDEVDAVNGSRTLNQQAVRPLAKGNA